MKIEESWCPKLGYHGELSCPNNLLLRVFLGQRRRRKIFRWSRSKIWREESRHQRRQKHQNVTRDRKGHSNRTDQRLVGLVRWVEDLQPLQQLLEGLSHLQGRPLCWIEVVKAQLDSHDKWCVVAIVVTKRRWIEEGDRCCHLKK